MKHRIAAARHSTSTLRERIRQAREVLSMSRAELARKAPSARREHLLKFLQAVYS